MFCLLSLVNPGMFRAFALHKPPPGALAQVEGN